MDALPLLPLGSELRSFPPTQRTLRVSVADDDFGAACRVRQGVLSERLLTSIHEHREELELTATAFGPRCVTADNPYLNERQRSRLHEQGIIRQGLVVEARDVLVSVLQTGKRQGGGLQVFRDRNPHSVSDESIYVQPAWIGARVEQAEHVPKEELGPGAPQGVESLSIVRLVRECELELGDVLLVEGQPVVVAGTCSDNDIPRDPLGQPADLIFSLSIGRRIGMRAGEHRALSIAKESARAEEALQVRSTGAYSLITVAPLGKGAVAPQRVYPRHVAWLQARGLTGILGELVSLKSDDLLGRQKIAASLAGGAALGQIDIPAPAAPDSLALLVSWLEALGLNVCLEPADGCVSLSVWPATSEELLARSHGVVAKPETINYRTYADEPGGLFCPRVFGPSETRRRRQFGHIALPCPIAPILWRLGNPSLLECLLGISPDQIERVLAFQADVFVRDGQIRLEEHNVACSATDLGPDWSPLHTGGNAIRSLLERLPAARLPPMLRGRAAALTPEVVLVAPPDLRPLVLLDSGNFATSDLNDHVRRVVNRRNRLVKLAELKAPQVILDNEMRMLQQTVDGLFANTQLPEGQMVQSDEGRALKCTLSMVLGHVLDPAPKRVDWSARARVLIQSDVPSGDVLVPQLVYDELQLDRLQPVLVTQDDSDGFVALRPRPHAANVVLIDTPAAEQLDINPDDVSEIAIHRPLGKPACTEALRLHRAGPSPPRKLEFHAGWLQAGTESEVISGLVAAAMSGEAVRLDTPELLLVGGTGSVDIAPDGVAKSNSATAG